MGPSDIGFGPSERLSDLIADSVAAAWFGDALDVCCLDDLGRGESAGALIIAG
jgi:hypothetical protein